MKTGVLVMCIVSAVTRTFGAEPRELDRAAMEAVSGKKLSDYLCRLEPFVIAQAPPVAVMSTPTIVLPAGQPLALRVNCGMDLVDAGWQYRDEEGRLWLADRPWHEGAQWGVVGGGATVRSRKDVKLPDALQAEGMYRAERYALDAYRFTLPAGRYTVRLHFIETYDLANAKPGRRVFDVALQGATVLKGFDPVHEAGPATPIVREFKDVDVSGEPLRITFERRSSEPPLINGIEIIGREALAEPFAVERGDVPMIGTAEDSLPPAPGPVVGRYLCGVGERACPGYELVTAYGGQAVWLPDVGTVNGFWAEKGGAGQRHAAVEFACTPAPQVLRHEQYGGEGYEVKVPAPGAYAVRLHFAEGFEGHYRPGLRVFDVSIEGKPVLKDFDPVAAGGGYAFASVFDVRGIRVVDGQLSIGLQGKVQSPFVNAIEVFRDEAPPGELEVRQVVGPAQRQPITVAGPVRKKLRVFYVGNSHTFFWAIPETVAAAVNTMPGVPIELTPYRLLHGGWTLPNFYAQTKVPTAPSAFEIMEQGRYDVTVLQVMPGGDRTRNVEILKDLRAFAEVADRVGTRLMLYDFTSLHGMDEESRTELLALVREQNMVLIPFGEAQEALRQHLAEAPHPLSMRGVSVHIGFHPAYLDACMHIIAWTGKSPVGHPVPALVGQDVRVDEETARFLQALAWEQYEQARKEYGLRAFVEERP